MRWASHREEKKAARHKWHNWFAWYPTEIGNKYYWLETVERKRMWAGTMFDSDYWAYREAVLRAG